MVGRLLIVVVVVIVAAALRAAYPVAMPLAVALVIVAAVWPIKQWLDRSVPPWLSYAGTVVALLVVSALFVSGIWFSAARVVDTFARNQARFNEIYDFLATWRQRLGIDDLAGEQTYAESLGLAQAVLTNIYTILARDRGESLWPAKARTGSGRRRRHGESCGRVPRTRSRRTQGAAPRQLARGTRREAGQERRGSEGGNGRTGEAAAHEGSGLRESAAGHCLREPLLRRVHDCRLQSRDALALLLGESRERVAGELRPRSSDSVAPNSGRSSPATRSRDSPRSRARASRL